MVDGGNQVVDEDNTTQIISKNAIRYRGYYYDEETKFYYLQSRYYNPDVGRFLNSDNINDPGSGILGYNTFIYCANNPVNGSDPTGHGVISDRFKKAYNAVKNCVAEIVSIEYDVPLYNQGDTNLCWAYSQMMIEDFVTGTNRTPEQAAERAEELRVQLHGLDDLTEEGFPQNCGSRVNFSSKFSLYINLLISGPMYAAYYPSDGGLGHMVVITGYDLINDIVFTNNPHNVRGTQSYDEFLSGYVGRNGQVNMGLGSVYTVVR